MQLTELLGAMKAMEYMSEHWAEERRDIAKATQARRSHLLRTATGRFLIRVGAWVMPQEVARSGRQVGEVSTAAGPQR